MFSEEEIELLMEGLDAIKKNKMNNAFTSGLIGAMFSKGEDRDAETNKMKLKLEEAERESKVLEERIIMLKAKLLQTRDKATVSEVNDFIKKNS